MAEFRRGPVSDFPDNKNLVFEKALEKQTKELLGRLKWNMDKAEEKYHGRAPIEPSRIAMAIAHRMRGEIAERLSWVTPVEGCETVFNTFDLQEYTAKPFYELTEGQTHKQEILEFFLKTGVHKSDTMEVQKAIKKNDDTPAGPLYSDSVLPDGVLVSANDDIEGFVEVKALKPQRIVSLVQQYRKLRRDQRKAVYVQMDTNSIGLAGDENVGVMVAAEAKFIETIRGFWGMSPMGNKMPMLIRFPADAYTEPLKEYAREFIRSGYPNVAIQKLGMTTSEMTERAKMFLRDNYKMIHDLEREGAYSKRLIDAVDIFTEKAQLGFA